MNPEEFDRVRSHTATHWWYRSLVDIAARALAILPDDSRILDAGCGTGFLHAALPNYRWCGIDLSREACAHWREDGVACSALGSVSRLPFARETLDAIICLDVIYHRLVEDDGIVIREFCRSLRSGGRLVLQVPAHEWLRNRHDRVVHTARRYSRDQTRELVEQNGFEIEILSYRNSLLTAPILLSRLIRREGSNLGRLPRWMNKLLLAQSRVETSLILGRTPVPLGSSVFCVARRLD